MDKDVEPSLADSCGTPKVSVVLPVYNGERFLSDSIDSCLKQTFEDFELIVVNDCSSDSSLDIANAYAEKDARVKVVTPDKNLGLPNALNFGFSHAQGEFWTWTSDDNAFYDEAIGTMVEALDSRPKVGLVYADMVLLDENGSTKIRKDDYSSPHAQMPYFNCVGACFMYRASIAKKVGGYANEWKIVEDYEYWLRLLCEAPFHYIDQVLYVYRRHKGSLSAMQSQNRRQMNAEVQFSYYQKFKDVPHLSFNAKVKGLTLYRIYKNTQCKKEALKYLFRALAVCPWLTFVLLVRGFEKASKRGTKNYPIDFSKVSLNGG